MSEYSYLMKICLFPDNEVGKKTLAKSDFLNNFFEDLDYMSTIGVEFTLKRIDYQKGIKLQFWIISEKEKNAGNWNMYIRGSLGVILMYDITNTKTLDWLYKCCKMVHNYREEIPILLVGNKLDLGKNREVTNERVETFKRDNEIASSMEISLNTEKNVEEMFLKISSMTLEISLKKLKEEPIQRKREKLKKIREAFVRDIDRIIWIHNKNLKAKRNLKKLKRLWRKSYFGKVLSFDEYTDKQRKLILHLTEYKNEIINANDIPETMKIWENVKATSNELNFLITKNKKQYLKKR